MKSYFGVGIIAFVLFSIIVSGCTRAFRNADADEITDKQTAEKIIEAINHFRADSGSFPESLNLLVPDYLDSIPNTTRGEEFQYRTFHDSNRGDDYELCFFDETSSYTSYGCCYMWWFDNPPNYSGWDCTEGAE